MQILVQTQTCTLIDTRTRMRGFPASSSSLSLASAPIIKAIHACQIVTVKRV